jgi:hypothetical protein
VNELIALVLVMLVVAAVVGPGIVDYVRARKAERRRFDEWVHDVREQQAAEFGAWRRRREETRDLVSRRVA